MAELDIWAGTLPFDLANFAVPSGEVDVSEFDHTYEAGTA